ncbi:MAG: hypothetical protein K2X66_18225 [Cyanobacteria bacterium]|nr:hypothetical protein [Cyanobacteriota bacterium]
MGSFSMGLPEILIILVILGLVLGVPCLILFFGVWWLKNQSKAKKRNESKLNALKSNPSPTETFPEDSP